MKRIQRLSGGGGIRVKIVEPISWAKIHSCSKKQAISLRIGETAAE